LETLLVETVDLSNLAGFVITAYQRDSVWISKLPGALAFVIVLARHHSLGLKTQQ
jgi:hypothetical protein